LDTLITKVGTTNDNEFTHSLQALANKYEYDTLTRLLEEACHR
jgi:hypothetical protein